MTFAPSPSTWDAREQWVREQVHLPHALANIFAGWWFQPLWNILVNWDDYSQYMKNKTCSKPPTSLCLTLHVCSFHFAAILSWFVQRSSSPVLGKYPPQLPGPWVLDAQPACSHLPMEHNMAPKHGNCNFQQQKYLPLVGDSCLLQTSAILICGNLLSTAVRIVCFWHAGAPDVWVLGLNNRRWIPRTLGVSFFSGSSPKDAAMLRAKSIVELLGIKPWPKASDSAGWPRAKGLNHFGDDSHLSLSLSNHL